MNHQPTPDENQDDLQAELVAYLDDELDDERRHQIDDLLAHVPAIRDTVAGLGRTWDALDHLPRSEVDESFTKSTVEMIAVHAASDVEKQTQSAPAKKRRGRIVAALAAAAALLIGYAATRAYWPSENEQLLADWPVIENLDEYARVPSVAFLGQLADAGLFVDGTSGEDSPADVAASSASPTAIDRAAIERMAPSQKSQLLRKWERFGRLEPDEQARMRHMHAAIERDPRAGQLRIVMRNYGTWLEGLNLLEQYDLARLDADERFARVRDLWREDAKRFSAEDLPLFREWLEQFAVDHREELVDQVPADDKHRFEGGRNRHRLTWLARAKLVFNNQLVLIDESDVDKLRQRLSPDGQRILDEAGGLDGKRELIGAGLKLAWHQAFRKNRKDRSEITQNELTEYFDKHLQKWEQDDLLRLPSNDMLDSLRDKYLEYLRDQDEGSREDRDRPERRSHGRPGEGGDAPEQGPLRSPVPGPDA